MDTIVGVLVLQEAITVGTVTDVSIEMVLVQDITEMQARRLVEDTEAIEITTTILATLAVIMAGIRIAIATEIEILIEDATREIGTAEIVTVTMTEIARGKEKEIGTETVIGIEKRTDQGVEMTEKRGTRDPGRGRDPEIVDTGDSFIDRVTHLPPLLEKELL